MVDRPKQERGKLRTRLLPHNTRFREELARAREALAIEKPLSFRKATALRDRLVGEWAKEVRASWVRHASSEELGRVTFSGESDEGLREQMKLDPLRRNAIQLCTAFDLPFAGSDAMLYVVDLVILMDEPALLGGLLGPRVDIAHEDQVSLMLQVSGMNRSTTKREWIGLWPTVEAMIRGKFGRPAGGKRPGDQLERDLIWWQWRVEGLKYREIADRWQRETEEIAVEDTVRQAVKGVRELMRPRSEPHFVSLPSSL